MLNADKVDLAAKLTSLVERGKESLNKESDESLENGKQIFINDTGNEKCNIKSEKNDDNTVILDEENSHQCDVSDYDEKPAKSFVSTQTEFDNSEDENNHISFNDSLNISEQIDDHYDQQHNVNSKIQQTVDFKLKIDIKKIMFLVMM